MTTLPATAEQSQCPLDGQCRMPCVVYKAQVTSTDDNTTCYVGTTANKFKERFRNYQKSFREEKYANKTELASYVRNLNKSKKPFTMKWLILKKN